MELEIIEVIKKWTEGEVNNFIKVWIIVFVSLIYIYYVSKFLPKGIFRFISIFPVICLNLILPLNLQSIHLGGATTFFLVWLSNFKLLTFAFGKGPLSESSSVSVSRFVALACFPIKIQKTPLQINDNKQNPDFENGKNGLKSIWNYGIKLVLIPLFLQVYEHGEKLLHPWLIMAIISIHLYVGLEIILAIFGGLARIFLGIELEPQFNDPYLSSSLQDFWGRRWNLMVPRILRPSIYDPVLELSSRVMGRKWAPLPAIFSTFVVSAIMHEVMLFYLGRGWPSWEMSYFFLLHGVALSMEVAVKKALRMKKKNGRSCELPWIIAAPLTIGFVFSTGIWLFFPEFLRCKPMDRAYKEYAAMAEFFGDVCRALNLKGFTINANAN